MTSERVGVEPSVPDKDLHYGHFAAIDTYRQANQVVVDELFESLPDNFFHLDVATGTGLIPQLLVQTADTQGKKKGKSVGIDPNEDSIRRAFEGTLPSSNVTVHYIVGYGQEADRLVADEFPQGADLVTCHDAIHEIEEEGEQRSVLAAMWRAAKEEGLISVTSAFTSIAMDVGSSLRGYGEWKLHLIRLTGAGRNREVKTLPYRTPDEYKQMLTDTGFQILKTHTRVVELYKEALKAIAKYPRFIEGFCRDLEFPRTFTLKELSNYMCQAVDLLRLESLPRNWYEIIARKVARPIPVI